MSSCPPGLHILLLPWFEQEPLFQPALKLLDEDSIARINRFRRKEDAWRGLLSRHLILHALRQSGAQDPITIERAERGKPYLAAPSVEPPIAFNVTHDHGLVAIAFERGPAEQIKHIGIDAMRLQIRSDEMPGRFVDMISLVFTPGEISALKRPMAAPRQIERIFIIWTLKEAYVKALGDGLGFELSRIDCRLDTNEIFIDSVLAREWQFRTWALEIRRNGQPMERYAVATAKWVGESGSVIFENDLGPNGSIITSDELLSKLGFAIEHPTKDVQFSVGQLMWQSD